MEQINETLDTVTKLNDEAAKLCEQIGKIAEAAQKVSNKCHEIQVQILARTADVTRAESEDAKQGAHNPILSMADLFKVEREIDRSDGNADMNATIAALEEELDQATPKSPTSTPRGRKQQEGDAATASAAEPKATGCPLKEEQPESKRQKATPVKIEDLDPERNDFSHGLPKESRSSASPEPTGPPKPLTLTGDQKEEEGGEQRPEAAKKAKPTSPPGDLRTPVPSNWVLMTAHKRMGLPDEEDIATIHMSAPPLREQVPKTFACTKSTCQVNCVHC